MKYISFNEIIELNTLLEEQKVHFRIHLRDACGRQSMWIEPLEQSKEEEKGMLYNIIETFFSKLHFEVAYEENRMGFWIIQK